MSPLFPKRKKRGDSHNKQGDRVCVRAQREAAREKERERSKQGPCVKTLSGRWSLTYPQCIAWLLPQPTGLWCYDASGSSVIRSYSQTVLKRWLSEKQQCVSDLSHTTRPPTPTQFYTSTPVQATVSKTSTCCICTVGDMGGVGSEPGFCVVWWMETSLFNSAWEDPNCPSPPSWCRDLYAHTWKAEKVCVLLCECLKAVFVFGRLQKTKPLISNPNPLLLLLTYWSSIHP